MKKSKLEKLKEVAAAATKGAATGGILGAANYSKDKIEKLKEARNNAMKDAGARVARAMGRTTAEKDAYQENQVGKKYKDVSPIMANGAFTSATPKKQDNNLTQAELDRKKKRR